MDKIALPVLFKMCHANFVDTYAPSQMLPMHVMVYIMNVIPIKAALADNPCKDRKRKSMSVRVPMEGFLNVITFKFSSVTIKLENFR